MSRPDTKIRTSSSLRLNTSWRIIVIRHWTLDTMCHRLTTGKWEECWIAVTDIFTLLQAPAFNITGRH